MTQKWPRLPATAFGLLGPYSVSCGPIAESGIFGEVNHLTRSIVIREGTPPNTQIHTLMHELVHVALHEAGAEEMLGHEHEELVCTAVGLYLAMAIGAGFLTVRK